MSALSQWPSFESSIYSGSISKLLCRSVFQCLGVLLSVFTSEKSQYVLSVCLTSQIPSLSSSFWPYKNSYFPILSIQFKVLCCICHCTKSYSAVIMHCIHLSDTAVISYLMIALSSLLFSSLHGH